jgi:ribosome biogenesis protein Nip4
MQKKGSFILIMHGEKDYVLILESYISSGNELLFKFGSDASDHFENQVELGIETADILTAFFSNRLIQKIPLTIGISALRYSNLKNSAFFEAFYGHLSIKARDLVDDILEDIKKL